MKAKSSHTLEQDLSYGKVSITERRVNTTIQDNAVLKIKKKKISLIRPKLDIDKIQNPPSISSFSSRIHSSVKENMSDKSNVMKKDPPRIFERKLKHIKIETNDINQTANVSIIKSPKPLMKDTLRLQSEHFYSSDALDPFCFSSKQSTNCSERIPPLSNEPSKSNWSYSGFDEIHKIRKSLLSSGANNSLSPHQRTSFLASLNDINLSVELKKSCSEKLRELSIGGITDTNICSPKPRPSLENLHSYYSLSGNCPFKLCKKAFLPSESTDFIKNDSLITDENLTFHKSRNTSVLRNPSEASGSKLFYSPKVIKASHDNLPSYDESIKNIHIKDLDSIPVKVKTTLNAPQKKTIIALTRSKLKPLTMKMKDKVLNQTESGSTLGKAPNTKRLSSDLSFAEQIEMRHLFELEQLQKSSRVSQDLLLDNFHAKFLSKSKSTSSSKYQTPEKPYLSFVASPSLQVTPKLVPLESRLPFQLYQSFASRDYLPASNDASPAIFKKVTKYEPNQCSESKKSEKKNKRIFLKASLGEHTGK